MQRSLSSGWFPPVPRIELVVDDTLFRRTGRKVFGARWCHDGSAAGKSAIGFGNCFVVLGIVVALPFCTRQVCLPVVCSIWEQGSKVVIARRLVCLLSERFSGRTINVTGDAAYVEREIEMQGMRFRLTVRPEDALFGTVLVWRGQARVAVSDPSRTIVDVLDDPRLGGGSERWLMFFGSTWKATIATMNCWSATAIGSPTERCSSGSAT